MTVDHKYFISKKNKGVVYASTFFLITVIATLTLFGVNKYIEKNNNSLNEEVMEIESSITEIKKDKKLQVKELLDLNSKTLADLKRKSKITEYIAHTKMINSKYGVVLEGFSYGGGKITMNTSIEADDRGLAYKKMVKYISEYRESAEAKFKLLFINSIVGQDTIKFASNFEIK